MMTLGMILLAFGVLWAVFKGYVVWDIAHDVYNGGGAPTLDFPVFCPIPLALGGSMVLSALDKHPFPGFGLVLYLCLALFLGFLHWWFDRLGEPERERQLRQIKEHGAKRMSADESKAPLAERAHVVTLSDGLITHQRPDGILESVRLDELRAVIVETNDEGPFAADVFWILVGEGTSGCLIPQGATGDAQLLELLQTLPGFDHARFIDAMGSTSCQKFLVWQREDGNGDD